MQPINFFSRSVFLDTLADTPTTPVTLNDVLVDAILDKKGDNVLLLDVRELCIFADYFLLCSADNERQLSAIAQSIAEEAKKQLHTLPLHIEGKEHDGWILADFGETIVHIFSTEQRNYYRLEELWRNAHTILHIQ